MVMRYTTVFLLFLVIGSAPAVPENQIARHKSIELPADNPMAELRAGTGVDTVRANCIGCHSTDYIVRQPPNDMKGWGGEVKKMINVFGAPISASDAEVIVQYLSSAYGPPSHSAPTGEKAGPTSVH
jgi:hypothetical protein